MGDNPLILILLYDFFPTNGKVNEDVFVYSNRADGQSALVIYHNKFSDTRGWVKTSAGFMDKSRNALIQKTLRDGLSLRANENDYLILRDAVSGLEYLRVSQEIVEKGLFVELGAYQCQVFLDIREIADVDGRLAQLHASLNGRGVASVDALLSGEATSAQGAETVEEASVTEKPKRATRKKKDSVVKEKAVKKVSSKKRDEKKKDSAKKKKIVKKTVAKKTAPKKITAPKKEKTAKLKATAAKPKAKSTEKTTPAKKTPAKRKPAKTPPKKRGTSSWEHYKFIVEKWLRSGTINPNLNV